MSIPSFRLFPDTWILHLGKFQMLGYKMLFQRPFSELRWHTRRPTHTHSECLILSPCGYSDPSHTHNVSDIWRGSVLQQKEDNVQVAHEGSHMYWCEARLRNKATVVLLLCTVGFGGLLQIIKTSEEDRGWVRGRGRCKRRNVWWEAGTLFYLCYSLDWSPIFHQQFHDFDAVFLAGNVQWSKTILCKRQSS